MTRYISFHRLRKGFIWSDLADIGWVRGHRMAALTATPPKQDVAFSSFKQEEDPVEEISDTVIDNTKDNETEDSKCDEDRDISRKESGSSEAGGGGGGKFTLGIEDGSEFMEEVAFSLQHHPPPPGEGQPPPGHWVSQPHGKNVRCFMPPL